MHDHLHHVTLAPLFVSLAAQVVLSGDVAENGVGFHQLRVSVDQVRKVGPFSESKVELLLHPTFSAVVGGGTALVLFVDVFGARVLTKQTNGLGKATNLPISNGDRHLGAWEGETADQSGRLVD